MKKSKSSSWNWIAKLANALRLVVSENPSFLISKSLIAFLALDADVGTPLVALSHALSIRALISSGWEPPNSEKNAIILVLNLGVLSSPEAILLRYFFLFLSHLKHLKQTC